MFAGIETSIREFWGKLGEIFPIWSTYHVFITNKTDSIQRYTINLSLTAEESMHQETLQIDIQPTYQYEDDLMVLSDVQFFAEGDYPMYASGSIDGVEKSDDSKMNYFRARN